MKVEVYNQKGEKNGTIELPKEIFGVPVNKDLLHQVVLSQTSNRRKKIAKTKDRSEVRGGGKKPWAQKGTGRARHGSIRSPLWIGGGVTFGPNLLTDYKKTLPVKIRRKALLMALSGKAKDNEILVLEDLKANEKPKTKPMAELFNKIKGGKGSGLVALPKYDKTLINSIRNIKGLEVRQARDLNTLDLLNSKYVILPKESIDVIKETFVK